MTHPVSNFWVKGIATPGPGATFFSASLPAFRFGSGPGPNFKSRNKHWRASRRPRTAWPGSTAYNGPVKDLLRFAPFFPGMAPVSNASAGNGEIA
jgi:hypothetical protein